MVNYASKIRKAMLKTGENDFEFSLRFTPRISSRTVQKWATGETKPIGNKKRTLDRILAMTTLELRQTSKKGYVTRLEAEFNAHPEYLQKVHERFQNPAVLSTVFNGKTIALPKKGTESYNQLFGICEIANIAFDQCLDIVPFGICEPDNHKIEKYLNTPLYNAVLSALKLSETELAKETGIMQNTLYRYKTGASEPGTNNIKKIAKQLGISEDVLLIDESQAAKEQIEARQKHRENRKKENLVQQEKHGLIDIIDKILIRLETLEEGQKAIQELLLALLHEDRNSNTENVEG